MGYSRSKQAVERVKLVLDTMNATNERFRLPCKDPLRMSYAIRDALAVVKQYPETYPDYTKLRDKFKIKLKHDHLIFEPRQKLEFGDPVVGEPVLVLANSLESMEIDEVQTVLEIVGACIKHKAPEFTFPDAELDEGEMNTLTKWASSSNYEISNTKPLTLRKRAPVEDNSTPNGGLKLG